MILILSPLENAVLPPVIRACEELGFEVNIVRSEREALSVIAEPEFLVLPLLYPYQEGCFVKVFRLKYPGTTIVALTSSPYISARELEAHGIDSVVCYRADPIEHIRELLSKGA